jgi:hypothetical protein
MGKTGAVRGTGGVGVRLGGRSAVTAAYDNFVKERNLHPRSVL